MRSIEEERTKLNLKHKIQPELLWYLVGLIVSDGSLSKDGRHIDVTSQERRFLEKLSETFDFRNTIGVKIKKNSVTYRIQIGDKRFYDFLVRIGLKTNKSLTLGELTVPHDYFSDFVRGVIDGDGEIKRWTHPRNGREQWCMRVSSGSRKFLVWLMEKMKENLAVQGRLYRQYYAYRGKRKAHYRLKYGKLAAQVICQKCYYEGAFGLPRKNKLAEKCIHSYKGWQKSKTICDAGVLEWQTTRT